MGLTIEREYEVPAQLMKAIFGLDRDCAVHVYAGDGLRVEVFDVEGESLSGVNHFCLSVGNREEFFRQASSRGADCLELRRGNHPVYFVRDPAGVPIEIKD
jgi:catechol 2,3-dioxygenase-like lactoylglutathione lyase family enzyme